MSNSIFLKKGWIGGSTVAVLLLGAAIATDGTAVVACGSAFAATNPPSLSQVPVAPEAGFAPLAARVKPAVVRISTVSTAQLREYEQSGNEQDNQDVPQVPGLPTPFGDFFDHHFRQHPGQGPMQHVLGSGFIVDAGGYIVTNNHVVVGARDVSVTLISGNTYTAKVIGQDAKTDLALLKIDVGHPLPYVTFGDSDSEHEGDWVIAMGNPYGLDGTVTAGIISAHGRNIDEGPYDDFLQIDAPINPGSSGGPLFNQSGQVVGIDTAIYSPSGGSIGIGFAIPSNVAKDIVLQLRDHGKVARGWLGVQMQPLTATLAKAMGMPNDEGVLVDEVVDGSPAQHAALEQGDVITAYDGKPIKNVRDLAMAVADTPAGKTVPITVWRNNHERTLTVTAGTESETRMAIAEAQNDHAKLGLALEPLTPDLRSQLNLKPGTGGVVVGEVAEASLADESGFRAGDVIERVDGKDVSTPAQVVDDIHAAEREKKPAIPILVVRNGITAYLGLPLSAR